MSSVLQDPPHPDPPLVPPPPVRVIPAQQAHLHAAACAVDEAAVPDVETHVGDRPTGVREGEQVARPERLVVVECGAGTAIPSVRLFCERLAGACGATLIRLNPREADVPPGQVGLAVGALEGLRALDRRLSDFRTGPGQWGK